MNKTRRDDGDYEIEIDIEKLIGDSTSDEWFYLRDLGRRRLFLTDIVDECNVSTLVRHIIQYNKEDKDTPVEERKPIHLFISSRGGDVDAGFELVDVIRTSKTPVYTINLGYWYSMGFLIGIAGHKRYATPNAKLLMHDGAIFTYDSGTKAHDRMEFQKRVEARIRDYVIERSRITGEEYDAKLRVEWYMFADEAKEKGLIDAIIGVDCALDEVS